MSCRHKAKRGWDRGDIPRLDPKNKHRNLTLDDYVLIYSSLPLSFVLHNRQTKYIGGRLEDFRKEFDARAEVGSIWLMNDTIDSIQRVEERAEDILRAHPFVLIGLHERFEETLCALETLYGHLYRFEWNSTRHAHDPLQSYSPDKHKNLVDRFKSGPLGKVYENFMAKNAADMALYRTAVSLFEEQQKSLARLRSTIRSNKSSNTSLRMPHCLSQ